MSNIKLKWYGTAAILLEQDGIRLLFDPFIPINDKAYKPPIDDFAAADHILVTHGHIDHISGIPAVLKKADKKPIVYCTAKPRETLIMKGVNEEHIQKIIPGDILKFGSFTIRVIKGKHIVFNKALVFKTFFNRRIFSYWDNFKYLTKEVKNYDEAGETVIYDIGMADKRILLLGSLNLDDNTDYPEGSDMLILPFQGRSDISKYAMNIADRLKPKKILLDHFDDTFPPISSFVNPQVFIELMKQKYPDVSVVCSKPGAEWVMV
jgi:L-ascorbate metabolism protein UlaG (beta-lactamase superfamily)